MRGQPTGRSAMWWSHWIVAGGVAVSLAATAAREDAGPPVPSIGSIAAVMDAHFAGCHVAIAGMPHRDGEELPEAHVRQIRQCAEESHGRWLERALHGR